MEQKQKQKIIELGYNDPKRKRNMDIETLPTVDGAEVALVPTVKHFVIDADGNRIEVEAPVLGDVQTGEGPVASGYATI